MGGTPLHHPFQIGMFPLPTTLGLLPCMENPIYLYDVDVLPFQGVTTSSSAPTLQAVLNRGGNEWPKPVETAIALVEQACCLRQHGIHFFVGKTAGKPHSFKLFWRVDVYCVWLHMAQHNPMHQRQTVPTTMTFVDANLLSLSDAKGPSTPKAVSDYHAGLHNYSCMFGIYIAYI